MSGMMSLAEKVASQLRQEIRSGSYAAGQRLSDEHKLADRFGVSRGTVRQALKILGTERLIIRHQGRGTFISTPAYGGVAESRSTLLAIMVYENEYFFSSIVHAASSQAATKGYMLITGENSSQSTEQQHIQAFINNRVRGVVVTPRLDVSVDTYRRLQKNFQTVFLDRSIRSLDTHFVSVDDYLGTFKAAEYLIGLGHRSLAYVGHDDPRDYPCQPNRMRGFADACRLHDIPMSDNRLYELSENDFSQGINTLFKVKPPPTAVVCFSDSWALRVIQAAHMRGLAVPGDISVVGFDDSVLSRENDIPLTSVAPKYAQVGRCAIDMLIEQIENRVSPDKRSVLIAPTLTVRDSTAPPLPS